MKKAIISLAIVLMFLPVVSHGATTQDLEKQRMQLLEQIIVMLKAQIQEIMAKKAVVTPTPTVGASVVAPKTTSTTTVVTKKTGTSTIPAKIVKKKRSGGGGGGGSSRRAVPPVQDTQVAFIPSEAQFLMGSSRFGFAVPAEVDFASESIRVELDRQDIPFWFVFPNTFTIKVPMSDGSVVNVTMVPQESGASEFVYWADLRSSQYDGKQYVPNLGLIIEETMKTINLPYIVVNIENTIIVDVFNLDYEADEENEEKITDTLELKSSAEDPDATMFVLVLEENDNQEEMIFAFDLSAEESKHDVTLNEIRTNVVVTGATDIDSLVNDFRLEIDGYSFAAESYIGTGATAILVFDLDGDVAVTAGEVVTAMLYADFENKGNGTLEGSTIQAYMSPETIIVESETDMIASGWPVIGSRHTLRTAGIDVEAVDSDAFVIGNDAGAYDTGSFAIEFEITAFVEDMYISTDPTVSFGYTLEDRFGSSSISGFRTVSLESSADREGASFKIAEGTTESFVFTMLYTPVSFNTSSRLQLNWITFGSSATNLFGKSEALLPEEDFRTSIITIVN